MITPDSREPNAESTLPRPFGTFYTSDGRVENTVPIDHGFIQISVIDFSLTALADTGAKISVIQERFFRQLPSKWINQLQTSSTKSIRMANGTPAKLIGQVSIPVNIGGITYVFPFLVLPECNMEIILGMDFLHHTEAVFDFRHDRLTLCSPHKQDRAQQETTIATLDTDNKTHKVLVSNLRQTAMKHTVPPKTTRYAELPLLAPFSAI